jgi:carbon monoxide dehydrogenase subunit G
LVDAEAPNFGKLEGQVEGSLGTIKGLATFRLAESGDGTTIDYEGHAVIGGPLARLDNRFVEGLAGSLINQGLRNLDTRLQGDQPARVAVDREQQKRETRA